MTRTEIYNTLSFSKISFSITGVTGAGKDTLANKIAEVVGVPLQEIKLSNAEALKKIASIVLNTDKQPLSLYDDQNFKKSTVTIGDKSLSVRELLITLGHGLRQLVHPEIWNNIVKNKIEQGNQHGFWVKTDDRYVNELVTSLQNNFIHIHITNKTNLKKYKPVAIPETEHMNLRYFKFFCTYEFEVDGIDADKEYGEILNFLFTTKYTDIPAAFKTEWLERDFNKLIKTLEDTKLYPEAAKQAMICPEVPLAYGVKARIRSKGFNHG